MIPGRSAAPTRRGTAAHSVPSSSASGSSSRAVTAMVSTVREWTQNTFTHSSCQRRAAQKNMVGQNSSRWGFAWTQASGAAIRRSRSITLFMLGLSL